jgi:hypothetical protein
MNNVVPLPASTTLTPEQALASAAGLCLKDVLIIGYDSDGDFTVRSSRMSRMDALWLAKLAERWALGDDV